jgi:hypothetical protein
MRDNVSLEHKWRRLSQEARGEAEKLPHGREREALMLKARQLETASQIDRWISSPGLESPK